MNSPDPQSPKPLFHNRKYLAVQIAAVLLITIVLLIGFVPDWENRDSSFAVTLILLFAVSFIYGITARHMNPRAKQLNPNNNPYHGFFFRGTVILTSLLTLFGLLGAFFVYVEHHNLFQAVGLATAVIWIAVFLVYFMWSVYFYNINYGITDQDWEKIYEINEMRRSGFPIHPSEDVEAPLFNPYRSQTFGLPPGTVRGMIAFTLLMGGMSLLIASMGSGYTGMDVALLRQQFEFFETAFLMMIAFYFGDRSLKYLSQRWKVPGSTNEEKAPENLPAGIRTTDKQTYRPDDVDVDDLDFIQEDASFGRQSLTQLASQKSILSSSFDADVIEQTGNEFVRADDRTHAKVLSDMDIRIALEEFEASSSIKLSLPVTKAVISIESSGRGHLNDGRAKILFEGHVFWRSLQKLGLDPKEHVKGNEDILFQKWTRQYYKGGAKEYERLERAMKINKTAAIYAASWGLFQIMGENLTGFIKGRNYADVDNFVEHQHKSEYYHLLDFLEFISTKRSRGKRLVEYISEDRNGDYDWEAFAYGYNGSGYAVNQYHIKMKAAYEKLTQHQRA